ncbi:hypothetical protein MPF_0353 [Methanohalophilus portucalensis FDF-1]|uniref:Uncharacterized protein n=1 Tax=Methanohalophilus portucalensis FDF-1 TaxID=523843 RepID=A0A1L9C4V5_9EURY|nr:hypothetical protein MPF_0353 [Methanohalophilus portucalensis FDF-1]
MLDVEMEDFYVNCLIESKELVVISHTEVFS